MTGWLIVSSLLLLLVVFAYARFSVFITHRGQTYIRVKYACFSLLVYPNDKNKQKGESVAPKKNEGIKDLSLIPLRENFRQVRKYMPSLTLSVHHLLVSVGAKEADKTAYLSVAVKELIDVLLAVCENKFAKVDIKQGYVYPNYLTDKIDIDTNIEVSFRFYQFLRLLFHLFFRHSFSHHKRYAVA